MILLKNGTYIDWQTHAFTETDLLIGEGPGGKVMFVKGEQGHAGQPVIDCTGKYIIRSFANGHHHAYSALATGMPSPSAAPRDFREILQSVWWKLDKALDQEMIRSSALVTAMACARNGVTFVIDHHSSPHSVPGSLEMIAQAFDRVGVSHLLCYEISDRDGPGAAKEGFEETCRYLNGNQGLVGLHASFTIGDETLTKAVELAESAGSGIHIHAAEDRFDQEDCMNRYGKRVIERLSQAGILGLSKSILAHCLHLSQGEREILSGSKAWIAENMESNLNNGVGFFRLKGLGSNIFLGTDGMHSDMMKSTKAAYFGGKHLDTPDPGEAYRRLRNVHHYIEKNAFTGDCPNNLIVFDYNPPTPFHQDNFLGHFFFGMDSGDILHVISDGKLIFRERTLMTVDEGEILSEAKIQAARLWKKMQ